MIDKVNKKNLKDNRRMFFNEMEDLEVDKIINFLPVTKLNLKFTGMFIDFTIQYYNL